MGIKADETERMKRNPVQGSFQYYPQITLTHFVIYNRLQGLHTI